MNRKHIILDTILRQLKRLCVIILIILVSSISLSSCVKVNSSSETNSEKFIDNRPSGYGNTPANICNGWGAFAQDENYVYYFSEDDSGNSVLNKSSLDFKETTSISNGSGSSLNVLNNCIYYINYGDNSTIYKMDTDGRNNQKINDIKSVVELMAINDKLYFIPGNQGPNGIYVMDTDGNNLKQLTDVPVHDIYIYDNVIYFIGGQYENDQYGMYKINVNGTEKKLLLFPGYDTINNLVIYNGYIYYSSMGNIFKISVDGGKPEVVGDKEERLWGITINICDNIIYYFTAPPPLNIMGIHALNLDTKEDKILTKLVANYIYIINNQIYFFKSSKGKINYYSMNLDGSNLKKLQ